MFLLQHCVASSVLLLCITCRASLLAPGRWDLKDSFQQSVKKVVRRKLDISSKALNADQFLSCESLKLKLLLVDTLPKGQLLNPRSMVTSGLPSSRHPRLASAVQEHTHHVAQGHACPVGEQRSIPEKLCLLFSAMLDRLTCFCCYVSTAPPLVNNQSLKHCSTLSNTWLRPVPPHCSATLHSRLEKEFPPKEVQRLEDTTGAAFQGFHRLHIPQIPSFDFI